MILRIFAFVVFASLQFSSIAKLRRKNNKKRREEKRQEEKRREETTMNFIHPQGGNECCYSSNRNTRQNGLNVCVSIATTQSTIKHSNDKKI